MLSWQFMFSSYSTDLEALIGVTMNDAILSTLLNTIQGIKLLKMYRASLSITYPIATDLVMKSINLLG